MKPDEAHAEKYLRHLGFADIVYEPDGNVPPDFLVNGRLAVEVRRLNQHEQASGNTRGLEEVSIPLLVKLHRLLASFGVPSTSSWFVFFRFRRPVESWKTLRPKLHHWFSAFRDSPKAGRTDVSFGSHVSLSVVPASQPYSQFFLLGGYSDENSGGWLLYELQRNVQICIDEKTRKVSRVRPRYPEWWLVLVDHIGFGLSDFDRTQFREHVSLVHDWEKVVLLSPNDHTRAFEV